MILRTIFTEAVVAEALTHRCGLCKAPPGQLCINTCQPGKPLPGRPIHFYRIEPPK